MDKGKKGTKDIVDCGDTLFLSQKCLYNVPRIQLSSAELMILNLLNKKNIMILKKLYKDSI